jgi:pimeloyl-ACP methyl ester carboxylesterase
VSLPSKLIFLPGARGEPGFWHVLGNRLSSPAQKVFVAYPGFGDEPRDPTIHGLEDLVRRLLLQIDQPTAIIAQSMGGILAVHAALQKPELVTHLVLSVTSGGVDMDSLGAADWRRAFAAANPQLPDWFIEHRTDLSEQLQSLKQPVLLLWGDADPISPVAVGQRLLALLPNAWLHVVAGGDHDLAESHAAQLAPLVDDHLQRQI